MRGDLFDKLIERTLQHEGGFVDNPHDPGGATNFGITQAVARESGYTGDMRDLPRQKAIDIYRSRYWITVRGDDLPPALAFQVFDAGVNHGPSNAIRWLQRAAGVADDGHLGPVSLAAIKAMDPHDLVLLFLAIRLEFYANLTTFSAFGRGWTRRVAGNLRFATQDN